MMIHVSRNGEEIAVVTRSIAEAAIRNGTFSRDDWAWSEGCTDWIPLHEMFPVGAPPPLPLARPKLSRRKVLVIAAVAVVLLLLFIVGLLAPDHAPSQNKDSDGYSSMPTFKGDRNGNPTQEDYDKAAKWLLDRDKDQDR